MFIIYIKNFERIELRKYYTLHTAFRESDFHDKMIAIYMMKLRGLGWLDHHLYNKSLQVQLLVRAEI